MTPGERLRMVRKERGLTPTELGKRAAKIMGRDRPLTASAVRNQENGTNGIPLDVATAYAAVLDVRPVWLVFGEINENPVHSERITVLGAVSGRWQRITIDPNEVEGGRYLSVTLPDFLMDGLVAYEVADSSLEPVFSKGDYLVTRAIEKAIVEGDIVLVTGNFASEILLAVRRSIHTAEGVFLGPVGSEQVPLISTTEQETARLDVSRRVVVGIRKFRDSLVPDFN